MGFGFMQLLLLFHVHVHCTPTIATAKVAVLGAGAAGLTAVGVLKQAGFAPANIYLIEADAQAGGRMKAVTVTDATGNWQAGMGAGWVHGINRYSGDGKGGGFAGCNSRGGIPYSLATGQYCNPVEAMAKKYSLPYITTPTLSNFYDFDGSFLGNDNSATTTGGKLDADCDKLLATLVKSSTPDVSIASRIAADTQTYLVMARASTCGITAGTPVEVASCRYRNWCVASRLENEYGSNVSDLSGNDYQKDEWYNSVDGILVGSFSTVTNLLVTRAQGVNLRYGARVTSVKTSAPASVTYIQNGVSTTLQVDYIISTLPLPIVQDTTSARAVAWTPALSTTFRTSLGKLKMGLLEKVVLLFDSKFWRPTVPANIGWWEFASKVHGEYPDITMVDSVNNKSALTFWFAATPARSMVLQPDVQVRSRIVQILQSVFPSATINVLQMYRSSWTTNPFSMGSYTFFGSGYSLSQDWNNVKATVGRLYWAGEHTRVDFPATVHGAMFSGTDAANIVCKALRGCSTLVRHPDTVYP